MKSGETKSPLDLSTPNIVMMTLKIPFPFPVSACTTLIERTERTLGIRTAAVTINKVIVLFLTCLRCSTDE